MPGGCLRPWDGASPAGAAWNSAWKRQPAAVQVKTATAVAEEWPQDYEATGTVRARLSAVLSSRVNGHILEVGAREGDSVEAGKALVILDARETEVGMKRAESMRSEAVAPYPNPRPLLKRQKPISISRRSRSGE